MSLVTGCYTIRSAIPSTPFVGRSRVEDSTLNPKKILSLPDEKDPDVVQWLIENLEDDRGYILRARDAPTVAVDNKVFATLSDFPTPEEWRLVNIPQYGNHEYLIYRNPSNDSTTGWVVPSMNANTQIAVLPIIQTLTSPSEFADYERFIIESISCLD